MCVEHYYLKHLQRGHVSEVNGVQYVGAIVENVGMVLLHTALAHPVNITLGSALGKSR